MTTIALGAPLPIATRPITSVVLEHLKGFLTPEVTVTGEKELTPVQVAREFGVSPATVRRWEASGILLPTRRIPGSRHRRYSRATVDALHRSMEAEAETPEAQ